jgi:hypothetical protein
MRLVSCSFTDTGMKRPQNEDSFLVDEELPLFVVADGMGGHKGGAVASEAEKIWPDPADAPGNAYVRMHAVRVRDSQGRISADINSQEPFDAEVEYWNLQDNTCLGTTLVLYDAGGTCIMGSLSNRDPEWHDRPRPKGLYRSTCRVPANFFPDGQLRLSFLVWGERYLWSHVEDDALCVSIHETEGAVRGDYTGGMSGVVRPLFPWKTEVVESAP